MKQEMPGFAWAVGGGKGGVGKSWISLGLAYWFGRLGRDVVIMDGDLGGANLHTMLGIRIPGRTLDDFLLRKVETLEEILIPTNLPKVKLIAGGSELPSLANPNYAQKTRVVKAMRSLPTDLMMVDLGAGIGLNTLDFFLACPNKVVVITPQPTSIQNAYGFIKAALYRQISRILASTPLKGLLDARPNDEQQPPSSIEEILEEVSISAPEVLDEVRAAVSELRIRLIVNMSANSRDVKAGNVIQGVCRRFLSVEVDILGSVPRDSRVERWSATMDPGSLIAQDPDNGALKSLYEIAYALLRDIPALEKKAA